uniref:Uncharacterized protein n=1 Tax=Trepomonas sp. PC1 TaxID=1076344 RepID=A0A146KFD3_9EUKA|eukprot:JAP94009.1 hypothetical protein TPC1_13491 [Trepomonas sp. PC1]
MLTTEQILRYGKSFSADIITRISLINQQLTDISLMSQLTQVFYVNVSQNKLQSIRALLNLPNLMVLVADLNMIDDLTFINPQSKLEYLSLKSNQIKSFQQLLPLQKFAQLQFLNLKNNEVSNDFDKLLQFTFENLQQVKSLNQTRIKLVNGIQISQIDKKALVEDQIEEIDQEVKDWVSGVDVIAINEFEFEREEAELKSKIQQYWEEVK